MSIPRDSVKAPAAPGPAGQSVAAAQPSPLGQAGQLFSQTPWTRALGRSEVQLTALEGGSEVPLCWVGCSWTRKCTIKNTQQSGYH